MMRIPTPAMRGSSRLLRVAKDKAATKEMRTGINLAKAKRAESLSTNGIAGKYKVAAVRKVNFAPHQTSSWSAKKKGY